MSFRCRFGCRSDHVGFPRNNFTVKMHAFRERRLNNFLFSNLVLLIAVSKKNGNPCGGRGVSPHLNASSQHLYLSLLQVFFIFKVHTGTYDLDVVLDVVQDVVPHLNGIPSKQLKPRIRCGGAANHEPKDHPKHSSSHDPSPACAKPPFSVKLFKVSLSLFARSTALLLRPRCSWPPLPALGKTCPNGLLDSH